MENAFVGCGNLNAVGGEAIDKPDLSGVTNLYTMFATSAFNQDIKNWDTSAVTNMGLMFYHAFAFANHDLSIWNVENVTSHSLFMEGAGTGNTEPIWP